MPHAAPRSAAQGEVMFADAVPGVLDRVQVIRLAGGAMQLGQADQVPCQLVGLAGGDRRHVGARSEEHTSELQALMRTSYAAFCLKKKTSALHDIPHQAPSPTTDI